MNPRSKRRRRQLALTEQSQETPRWAALPEDCRREVVALLARLLLGESNQEEEVADE